MKSTQKIVEEMLKEAKDAEVLYYTPLSAVSLDDPYVFRIEFNSRIGGQYKNLVGDKIAINILDMPLLIQKINNYLEVAKKHFADEKLYTNLTCSSKAKRRIANLFLNASYDDLQNIYKYVDDRKERLKKTFKSECLTLGEYTDEKLPHCLMVGDIDQLHSNMEACAKFTPSFIKCGGGIAHLPSVLFENTDDTAYIYAVQNFHTKEKENSEFAKQMDRYLRKVNKNVDPNSIEANVSPKAVVSLSMFIKFMHQKGITKFIAPDFLPLRYQTNVNLNLSYAKKENKEDLGEVVEELNQKQYNITNKFMHLFLRETLHFDNLDFQYDDVTQKAYMTITKPNYSKQDNIIQQIVENIDIFQYVYAKE